MKLSKLIEELQAALTAEGDITVAYWGEWGVENIEHIQLGWAEKSDQEFLDFLETKDPTDKYTKRTVLIL